MSDLSYQLGQFCAAMNELHLGYCEAVRNGLAPSKLIGSSVYSIALKSPSRALDFLASRIGPYQSWVKQAKFQKEDGTYKKSDVNNAIHASRWMEKHAPALYQAFSANHIVSQTHTAELMLGYLAGRDFNKKVDDA